MGHQGHSTEGTAMVRDWVQGGCIGDVRGVIAYSRKNYWTKVQPVKGSECPKTLEWDLFLNRAETIPFSSSYMNREWIRYSHFSGIYMEKPRGMSAWVIGETLATHDLTDAEYVRVTEAGPVRVCVEALKRWGHSKFIQRTWVYRSYPRIDFELEAHWFELGEPGEPHPMLRAVFPLAIENPRFDCHVPFDVVSRPTDGTEVPAQHWVDVTDGEAGVALINETKYGHSFVGGKGMGELRLTLLRSSHDPDRYPDQGMHFIRYSLFPHEGDWKSGVWAEGEAVNFPALSAEPPSASLRPKEPTRPPESSLVSLDPATLVLSTLKQSEEAAKEAGVAGVIARIVEVEGAETTAVLTFQREVRSAERVDLLERKLDTGVSIPVVEGPTVRVRVRPHEIVSLRITL